MILRRVMEHFRKQEWTAVAIDFVIVVLGVVIGIQVSNWNQFNADRRTEANYLAQLQRDLQSTYAELRDQIEFERFQAGLASSTFEALDQAPSEDRTRRLRTGLITLSIRRTLKIESPTFLDLQSSGKLDMISDPTLRNAVISYFFHIQRLESAIDKNNAFFVDEGFNDFLREAGVAYRAWDLDAARAPAPDFLSAIEQDRLNGPLFEIEDALSRSPPDAEIWRRIAQHLSWRAGIAAANENLAQQMMQATTDLETSMASHLDRVN